MIFAAVLYAIMAICFMITAHLWNRAYNPFAGFGRQCFIVVGTGVFWPYFLVLMIIDSNGDGR